MTAKEKAKELVYKFISPTLDKGLCKYHRATIIAKQCALIAVDELMQQVENSYYNKDIIKGAKLYLQEVKQEIEKL